MILFFSSPIGLGHATRDIAILDKLKRIINNDILLVSGGAASNLISNKGFSVLDLYKPNNFTVKSGELRYPFIWLMKYVSYYKKCKRIAETVINNNKETSNLIVSDEDFASISVSKRMNFATRVLITDVTETHFTRGVFSIVERSMNKSMRKLIGTCDLVIIPYDGDDYENVVHTGPIVRESSAERDALRKKFALEKKTILVSAGGTDAGRYLIEKSLVAFRNLRKRMDIDLILVSGPSLKLDDDGDFRNTGFVDDLHEYIYASDLIISLAGKSTIDESIIYGTPGIFIPIRNHFEQEENAKHLGFRYEDILRLESIIEEKLYSPRVPSRKTNGAAKAAGLISKFV
jgi:UDP-N-acetylglucosamine--N-acetylmuramyl-(pentapeptide) pyrophosphoryl-undecaprenol N-acetylglucosamine transferase